MARLDNDVNPGIPGVLPEDLPVPRCPVLSACREPRKTSPECT